MAEALKNHFGPEVVRGLAKDLKKAWKGFPADRFLEVVLDQFSELELMDRVRHIAEGLTLTLPKDFSKARKVVFDALGPELEKTEGHGMAPFRYLPYGYWVAKVGLGFPKESLELQLELTKRCTSEFSVRFFLEEHYTLTLEYLEGLVSHSSPHVRRWVSEGTRPHLPWGKGVPILAKNPEGHLHLLEALRDDPHIYVRKSVANHLNDLSRHHPKLLLKICQAWGKKSGKERAWILNQALRSLVKKGNIQALKILGYGQEPKVDLEALQVSPCKVNKGEKVNAEWELISREKQTQSLMVDLVVHYCRPGGKTFEKTFKLSTLELLGGKRHKMKKKISLVDLSTRVHHPGRHNLELLVNGRRFFLGFFDLVG